MNGNYSYNYKQLRRLAADHIRMNRDEYAPFLGLSANDLEFDHYCDKMASESLCEWGGQLELKALAAILECCINIYSAQAPTLVMGQADVTNTVLKITFHQHYYALGEHYNSTESITNSDLNISLDTNKLSIS